MRPDQHKKKKNAEYKKKHGIQSQGKKNDKQSPESDARRTADENRRLKERNERSSCSDEELKEGGESYHGQRSFSRRQLESNWDRYKDTELDKEFETNDVPTVSKIGVDFQALLNKPADPTSQFHFQDEKEWENLIENEAKCKVCPMSMSIDCTSLAQALRIIPLDRRLAIDKKYFEDGPLIQNDQTSLETHCSNSLLTNDKSKVHVYTGDLKETVSQTSFHFFKPNELPERLKLNENVTEPTYNDQSVLSLALKAEMNTNHSQKTGSNYTMLGLERTERNPDAEVKIDQIKRNDGKHVLGTTDRSEVDLVPQLSKVPQESKEDLEDWLDSILD